MKKAIAITISILLLIPLAFGVTFFVDSEATLWGSCKNNTYADSTAKIGIRYPNGSIFIANDTMSIISQGQFNYTFITPNATGNYLTQIECNIGTVLGVDEDDFWVRDREEEMTSLAVVIFIIMLTLGVFLLPKFVKRFSENRYLDSTLRGLTFVFGLFLLSLDTAMVVTVADNAKLGISRELFRLLWLINWAAYLAMAIVTLVFGWKMLQMWNIDKQKRNSGEVDFDEE